MQWRTQTPASPPAPATPTTTPAPGIASNTQSTATATQTTTTSSSSQSVSGTDTAPPGDYYVVDGDPVAAGVVMLFAQPDPLSSAALQGDLKMYGRGC